MVLATAQHSLEVPASQAWDAMGTPRLWDILKKVGGPHQTPPVVSPKIKDTEDPEDRSENSK